MYLLQFFVCPFTGGRGKLSSSCQTRAAWLSDTSSQLHSALQQTVWSTCLTVAGDSCRTSCVEPHLNLLVDCATFWSTRKCLLVKTHTHTCSTCATLNRQIKYILNGFLKLLNNLMSLFVLWAQNINMSMYRYYTLDVRADFMAELADAQEHLLSQITHNIFEQGLRASRTTFHFFFSSLLKLRLDLKALPARCVAELPDYMNSFHYVNIARQFPALKLLLKPMHTKQLFLHMFPNDLTCLINALGTTNLQIEH